MIYLIIKIFFVLFFKIHDIVQDKIFNFKISPNQHALIISV